MTLARLRSALPQLLALALVLGVNAMVFPSFFDLTVRNERLYGPLIDVLNRGAPVMLLAIGMTLVIATKGVDLSVGAIMAISGAVAATLTVAGVPVPLVILASLGVGLVCGLWNGILVAVLDIQPIIATLILMVAGRGIAQLVTSGFIVTFNDPTLFFIGSGSFLFLPMPVVIALVMAALVILLVRRTALGLLIEATGINRRASALAGIDAKAVLIAAYMTSGLCASVAGIIAAADIRGADANNAGLWLELDAILAVVIGGTSLMGGRFSIPLALVGALIIQAMNTGILLSGFPPEMNLILKAVLIALILVLQSPAMARVTGLLTARRAPAPGPAAPTAANPRKV
ncbi:ABC transporter permease [Aureimonas phyllosphaerae]|uniref:Simple sugar transport system permease protein n=1 Tax=Aureimonas phyllosphaerae TaxID=1166078 RepID=A0A7W6FW44_9HYPH|nr:ABC transporter permease [Aureimonas phyllosphaerae]MBB3937833.1 simple sugar transport system permease protein [Aureimonas phyllosphaerae]MBB3961836.1 simple sugar transport system permease protein [Aureimonas phyllosphaerae]SFF50813.1 monosaccharide ABC transporter membrane protein, CUT2 family [Aureimonas phyllosphaerae]